MARSLGLTGTPEQMLKQLDAMRQAPPVFATHPHHFIDPVTYNFATHPHHLGDPMTYHGMPLLDPTHGGPELRQGERPTHSWSMNPADWSAGEWAEADRFGAPLDRSGLTPDQALVKWSVFASPVFNVHGKAIQDSVHGTSQLPPSAHVVAAEQKPQAPSR